MIPVLYSPTETDFTTYGLGALPDAISPHVVEERNGEFTFEMQYPVDGTNYELIGMRSIIKAMPRPKGKPQPFRVYRMTKPINGIVTVYARHIRYDLEGVPVYPFTSSSLYTALTAIKSNMMVDNPFYFYTDKTSNVGMTLTAPATTTSLMGGSQGSLLDIYGGEYDYDEYRIFLKASRGQSTNVVIRYGVNLIDLEQEENCANVYTGVVAFWKSSQDDQYVMGDVQSVGTFDFTRIKLLDRSANYEGTPTKAQLNNDAVAYANEAKIGVPKVSITLSFVDLQQIEEYAIDDYTLKLCDQVTVEFEKLGVSATAKIIRTDFDVITERYISLDIGDSRTNIAETIIGISTKAEAAPTATEMQQAITATTAAITGANGGAVRVLDTNSDGLPDTLYIADNPDPNLATKVWRWNYEGWGASDNGYSGPFTMGATFLQGFIADFITAGTLNADRIGANSIAVSKMTGKIENGEWAIDFDNGTLSIGTISASEITSGTLDASQITVKNLNADNITTGTLNVLRIADNSLTNSKLKDNTIEGGKIAPLTITGAEVANQTLSGGKIASNTLSDTQIAAQGVSTASLSSGVTTSLGYADFSNSVFNSNTQANYCKAYDMTCTHILSADARCYINTLYVSYGGTYFTAEFKQPTVTLNVTETFKVYDINGGEHWSTNIGSASISTYVLAH